MVAETKPDPRALARELVDRRAWSATQLRAHQRARLTALLRHAQASSPYYARHLPPRTDLESVRLEDLPTLPKATLMERFDEIVTSVDARVKVPGDAR